MHTWRGTAVISETTTAVYDGLVAADGNGNGRSARERKFRRRQRN